MFSYPRWDPLTYRDLFANPDHVFMQDEVKFEHIIVTGKISIEPVTTKVPQQSKRFLIMGPTGAGKSSFVEAIAGSHNELSISKDQLAGYTQQVTPYLIVDAVQRDHSKTPSPICLIDTPGFSDTKISELEIMDMIHRWLRDNDLTSVDRILFLTPINVTRLPKSRRRTMKMLKQALMSDLPRHGSITFVTTMWDTLPTELARGRAEANFMQLQDIISAEFGRQATVTRFYNTVKSAFEVMDTYYDYEGAVFSKGSAFPNPHLYQDLHERITNAIQERRIIKADLSQVESNTNAELRSILEKNLKENNESLMKFVGQVMKYGPPPGYEDAHKQLRSSIEAVDRMLIMRVMLRQKVQDAKQMGNKWFKRESNKELTSSPNTQLYDSSPRQ